MNDDCKGKLHPKAAEGIRLFNEGKYFEAHEELEAAWKEEHGKVRELYQGILEAGVTYLHITRGNYKGAMKVYGRSMRWLRQWPASCRGVDVAQLREDLEAVIASVERLGENRIAEFDLAVLKPVRWEDDEMKNETKNEKMGGEELRREKRDHIYICDRCGHEMYEKNCRVTCPNCGNRFDCSDLNIYFD